ncbi:hypothetical protein PYH37_005253 [Sinorhizobium numidicum]|uniref:Transmembrane protein n=1 Tax=Sinorhizobium numidicum TaxID=680248 RepID=A0ABY8D326_9HYPH|nr:hypothetical protein [Sinorhizobium numidicum]WEX76902.1 hypothetical protein PYH37_005253 [Sinorhizobium numidicum]WEX83561.1 hypothetical protein PYH38_002346 [Sinorhizobium numidicum]
MSPGKVALSESEQRAAETAPVDMAALEVASLQQGKTREQLRQEAEDGRTERFRQHFECIAIGAVWIAAFALSLMAAVWMWHLVSPQPYRWLDDKDLWTIQTILTAGALLSIVSGHFKKRME